MTENTVTADPSCADPSDPGLLSVAAARQRILDAIEPIQATETLPLHKALGRVLAGPVSARIDVPGHTNSAMDGYACAASDLEVDGAARLTVVGKVMAGRPFDGAVGAGQAVRIMTGGAMPAGTDTVVMQEQAERDGDAVRFAPGQRPGQNVRQAGEDIASGATALPAGTRLLPAALGLAASVGIETLDVIRPLRVSLFATGDELRAPGQPLAAGQIYNSNSFTLHGMLERLGVQVNNLGIVADTPEAVRAALQKAAEESDVVLSSGGVSVGEADYVKQELERLGEMQLWRIAMKPGRPLSFGRIGQARFFGLPGNPVSAMVTFYQFVRPALLKLAGAEPQQPFFFPARCTEAITKRTARAEYMRGVLSVGDDGLPEVRRTGAQGSGILSSMVEANCLIELPAECQGIEAGETVRVQPFDGLV